MATLTSSYQYIGRSNGVKAYGASWYYYILLYAKTTGDSTTGKHTVSVKMRLACNEDSTFYGYRTTGSAKVGSTTAISWSNTKVPATSWENSPSLTVGGYTYKRYVDLKEGTAVIDTKYAQKDVVISTSWKRLAIDSTPPSFLPKTTEATASITVTLPVIASASVPTLSASSVTMLNDVTITTNRKSSSFTHDLTYSFGGSTGTIATGVGASYKWTVPDLVSKISGKKSGTCTITCKTKSGTTVIGTKTVTLTLNIPAKSTPSASASTVQMGKSVTIYTNRKSSGYTHTITYAIGTASGTIATGVTSSKAWIPPKSLAAYTGNKTSATCTITCDTYNGTYKVGSATTQVILTVPNATVPSLSTSSIVLGNPITINTPREVDCYEHDISYTLKADGSSTVAFSKDFNGPVQESYEWTPSLTMLAPEIPNATKGTITITCTTRFKDSTTVVGVSDPISFTVTVPDNSTTQPKVTAMSLTPVHSLSSAFNGVYVAGKSKVEVTYEASSDYSTIKSYATNLLSYSSSENPYTSPVLANPGTVSITGKVTDARGYCTDKDASITVIDYSRPRIIPGEGKSNIVCVRCNSNGKADPGGVYLLIQIGRKYSKVVSGGSQKNYCKLSYQWKTDAQDDSGYSEPVELLARTATSDYVSKTLSGIVTSNTTAYNIRLIVADDVGETETVTITVPTAFATFHSPIGGHGFTLGGYHDPAKYDVFDCKFAAEFEGDVYGKVLGLGALPEILNDADFNDYKDVGSYSVRQNAIAKTLKNCPSTKAGTLRVWAATGNSSDEAYVYAIQEYIEYSTARSYRRTMERLGMESAWNYGDWIDMNGKAIVAQGTTDGWEWVKYANGVAECWRRVRNTERDVNTAWSGWYYEECDEVTFPFSFSAPPVVNATIESGTSLLLMSWQGTDGNGTTTATKPASYRVIRPTTITGASFTIAYHAIGRWK